MLTTADCLPTGREERAEIGEVIGAINKHLHHCEITLLEEETQGLGWGRASIDGLVFDTEVLYCFQNNEHHEEGWLYNHIIGMLQHLERNTTYIPSLSFNQWDLLDTPRHRYILEMAIFWSDLGKLETTELSYKKKKGEFVLDENGNKIPNKVWDDGTLQSTAIGHDKASAEMFAEARKEEPDVETENLNDKAIHWIVAEHMNAHKLSEMDEQGKTTIPDFLQPQVEGLDAWDWPEWADLDIPHGESMGKRAYAWIRRGASDLLRIKQQCDDNGRISEVNF